MGGYSDWAARGKQLKIADTPDSVKQGLKSEEPEIAAKPAAKTLKLSYKYQRELDLLPEKIAALEVQISELQKSIERPEFYDQPFEKTQPLLDELGEIQTQLDKETERWFELEEMKTG